MCTLLSFPCSLVSSETEEITICVPSLESKHPQSQILIESVGTFGLLGVSSLDISQFWVTTGGGRVDMYLFLVSIYTKLHCHGSQSQIWDTDWNG